MDDGNKFFSFIMVVALIGGFVVAIESFRHQRMAKDLSFGWAQKIANDKRLISSLQIEPKCYSGSILTVDTGKFFTEEYTFDYNMVKDPRMCPISFRVVFPKKKNWFHYLNKKEDAVVYYTTGDSNINLNNIEEDRY